MEAKEQQRTYSSIARGSRRERGRDGVGVLVRDPCALEADRERDWERDREMERERELEREGGYGERRHVMVSASSSLTSAVLTQKSYSSSETLRALEHTDSATAAQTLYPPRHRMPDMVPREREEYRGTGEYQHAECIWRQVCPIRPGTSRQQGAHHVINPLL